MKKEIVKIIPFFYLLTFSFICQAQTITHSDTDDKRIEGVHKLQKFVELFKEKVGYYPFSNGPKSYPNLQFIVVHLTDQPLVEDDIYPPRGITGTGLNANDFIKEASQHGLFNDLNIYFDSRPVVPNASCQKYYIYHWNGSDNCYSIGINLEQARTDTTSLEDNCHSYVVSNCSKKGPYNFFRSKPKIQAN